MRRELESALLLARNLPADELVFLVGDLEAIKTVALARITAPIAESKPDEWLDVAETSRRMGLSIDYLYRHSYEFPFTRREGRRLLFSSAGLDGYMKKPR